MQRIENIIKELTDEELKQCYEDSKILHTKGWLNKGFLRELTGRVQDQTEIDYNITHVENEVIKEIVRRLYG